MKIGIDLGGSHVAIGVVDNKGKIVEKVQKRIMKAKSDKKGAFNDKIYLEYVDEEKRNIEEEKELNKEFRK